MFGSVLCWHVPGFCCYVAGHLCVCVTVVGFQAGSACILPWMTAGGGGVMLYKKVMQCGHASVYVHSVLVRVGGPAAPSKQCVLKCKQLAGQRVCRE